MVATSTVVACGSGDTEDRATDAEPISAERCVVWLHGKSETGAAPVVVDGIGEVSPTGNGTVGGGNEWIYFPEERFDEAVGIVAGAVDENGCERIAVGGFSNGAAFAAALYCNGETFGDRLAGVVVDDPPPDEAVSGCAPAEGVDVALYWTGALDEMAVAGADCEPIGWTCAGGRLLGLDAYAAELATEVLDSPESEHRWFRDAPQFDDWLAT